jgi:ABC-type Fe3+ transport system permease subunit
MAATEKWARWMTWLGIAIVIAGIVLGIWLEVSVGNSYRGLNAAFRTQERLSAAVEGFSMVSAGALLAVAAQILGFLNAQRQEASTDSESAPHVSELLD